MLFTPQDAFLNILIEMLGEFVKKHTFQFREVYPILYTPIVLYTE